VMTHLAHLKDFRATVSVKFKAYKDVEVEGVRVNLVPLGCKKKKK